MFSKKHNSKVESGCLVYVGLLFGIHLDIQYIDLSKILKELLRRDMVFNKEGKILFQDKMPNGTHPVLTAHKPGLKLNDSLLQKVRIQ